MRDSDEFLNEFTFTSLINEILEDYSNEKIEVSINSDEIFSEKNITFSRVPEVIQSLSNIIDNAFKYAKNKIVINLKYAEQATPAGLAQAYVIAERFLDGSSSALILGDNIFFGHGLPDVLQRVSTNEASTIFSYHVANPSSYGVVSFDQNNDIYTLEEKPEKPKSNYAVTGLYFLDNSAPKRANLLVPSDRGELEITDINKNYLDKKDLNVFKFGRGHAWLDTGTHESLLEAGQFVATLEHRQGLKIACLEEIAYRCNYISLDNLERIANNYSKNNYGNYLNMLVKELK